MTELEELAAQVETLTTFFDLEWIAIDDVRAGELLEAAELEQYEHPLRQLRRTKPHRLTDTEERILTEEAVSGVGAWARLLDEQLSGIEVELGGERSISSRRSRGCRAVIARSAGGAQRPSAQG